MVVFNSADDKTQTIPDKRKLTEAQKKLDSQLLYALERRKRGAKTNSKSAPLEETLVRFDEEGRAIVGIRARVTRTVLDKIESLGGKIVFTSERYNDILAHLPLEKLEKLAALQDVRAIMPAQEATTNNP